GGVAPRGGPDSRAVARTARDSSQRAMNVLQDRDAIYRYLSIAEALAFSAFTALFIWRWQTAHPESWLVFPIWLAVSFVVHRDTPKTIGWRADNLWPATRRAALTFGVFVVAVCLAGLFMGALHRLPEHLIDRHRFIGYFSFCLLQQVALNSYLTNRFLSTLDNPWKAAILSGTIFAALHLP